MIYIDFYQFDRYYMNQHFNIQIHFEPLNTLPNANTVDKVYFSHLQINADDAYINNFFSHSTSMM